MKIEYINPFLVAGTSVLSDMCGLKLTAGKPYVKTTSFDSDYIVISLGVTGQIAGQVLLAFHNDVACDIASKMCMMPITALDELSLSALSELGNMILGNAATVLSTKGVFIDIICGVIVEADTAEGSGIKLFQKIIIFRVDQIACKIMCYSIAKFHVVKAARWLYSCKKAFNNIGISIITEVRKGFIRTIPALVCKKVSFALIALHKHGSVCTYGRIKVGCVISNKIFIKIHINISFHNIVSIN